MDPSKETAICSFCGTPFITEKAINNYNTTNVTNIENLHADVVTITDERGIDNQIRSAEAFVKLGYIGAAQDLYRTLTKDFPYDYRGWWGLITLETKDFEGTIETYQNLCYVENLYSSATTVAAETEKKKLAEIYLPYIQRQKNHLKEIEEECNRRVSELNTAYEAEETAYKARRKQLEDKKAAIKRKEISTPLRWAITFGIFAIGSILSLIIGIVLAVISYYVINKYNEKMRDNERDQEIEISKEIAYEDNKWHEYKKQNTSETDDLLARILAVTGERFQRVR